MVMTPYTEPVSALRYFSVETIQQKRERRAAALAKARKLLDSTPAKNWNDSHQAQYDELLGEATALDAEIEREQRLLDLQAERDFGVRGAPIGAGQDAGHGDTWIDMATGRPVAVLSHGQRFARLEPRDTGGLTFGSWLRHTLVGWRERGEPSFRGDVSTSGISVPAPLTSEFIDRLRAEMVLSRAGARTVEMPGKTLTMVRITGDPTVSWHAENATITASDPTFDAVTLTSKTVVGLTKFSLELAQDSANFEEAATRALTSSLARAIDAAGLFGTGAGNSPSGVTTYTNRQTVTSIGAPSSYDFVVDGMGALLGANVPLDSIGACIMHTRLWTDLAKLKTGITSDKTPLQRPPAIQQVPFLTSTAVPVTSGTPDTTTAFIANWSDLLFGVRREIQIVPLREAFLGSNLQMALLVYARVDFAPAHQESFCTLEGISLS